MRFGSLQFLFLDDSRFIYISTLQVVNIKRPVFLFVKPFLLSVIILLRNYDFILNFEWKLSIFYKNKKEQIHKNYYYILHFAKSEHSKHQTPSPPLTTIDVSWRYRTWIRARSNSQHPRARFQRFQCKFYYVEEKFLLKMNYSLFK